MLVMDWLPLFSHFKSTHAEGENCKPSTSQFPACPLAASNVLATDSDFRGKEDQ